MNTGHSYVVGADSQVDQPVPTISDSTEPDVGQRVAEHLPIGASNNAEVELDLHSIPEPFEHLELPGDFADVPYYFADYFADVPSHAIVLDMPSKA